MTGAKYWDTPWNPVRGCSPASAGCANCWAASQASRFGPTAPESWWSLAAGGRWTGEIRFDVETLAKPLRWRKPRKIAVCWMGDLFHPSVPFEFIAAVYGVMAACPHLTFLTLTKRPARRREFFEWVAQTGTPCVERNADGSSAVRYLRGPDAHVGVGGAVLLRAAVRTGALYPPRYTGMEDPPWPLPNVWEGTSVEDQETADLRLPDALATPAAHLWVSYEPALGGVDFSRWLPPRACDVVRHAGPFSDEALVAVARAAAKLAGKEHVAFRSLDAVVVGAESGPHARPCDVYLIRDTVRQCRSAGVAAYVKQIHDASGKLVADPAEFPEDLRIRELPWNPGGES